MVTVGATKVFDVIGSDRDPGDSVTLNVVGLPTGATMTPSLPVAGNPVSSMFSWAPNASQVGMHVINFSASSTGGGFALCPVTLVVETGPIPGDIDGDGDVDQDDLTILVGCFGQPPSACVGVAPGVNPDFNEDGIINILDISFVGSHFTP